MSTSTSPASTSLAVAGLITLVSGLIVSLALARDPVLIDWSYTHWAFTYDYGFIKRGLAGTVLNAFISPESLHAVVERVALVNSVCAAAALIYFFWRPYVRTRQPSQLVFAVLATTHFATLQHFFYDLGRFDQLGLLLCCGCLMAIERCGRNVTAIVVLALSCVGVLIHEAFLMMFMPLILAYWLFRQSPRLRPDFVQVGVALLIAGLTMFVVVAGKPTISQAQYVERLKSAHGAWVEEKSVRVLFGGPQSEAQRTSRVLLSPKRIVHTVLLLAFLLPSLLLLAKVARAAARTGEGQIASRAGPLLLVLAALSPLSLYVIGLDFARWWALAITNVLLAMSLLMTSTESWNVLVGRTFAMARGLSWSVLALSFIAGPLGVAASPFPRLEPYVQATMVALLHAVR